MKRKMALKDPASVSYIRDSESILFFLFLVNNLPRSAQEKNKFIFKLNHIFPPRHAKPW